MSLYAVHLLFVLRVEANDAPAPTKELAIYVLSANDINEAREKGNALVRVGSIVIRTLKAKLSEIVLSE